MDDSTAWECRDPTDFAENYYNHPLRTQNRQLQDENLALKRLLRENGISWQSEQRSSRRRSSSRHSFSSHTSRAAQRSEASHASPYYSMPHLPVEVQLKILSYALTSSEPIIDPLCKSNPENLTSQEKARKNQISIHFLATCKAYHTEGVKFLWTNNRFLFTSPESLKNFAEVPLRFRRQVKDVTLRIVAKFYDDEERPHRLPSNYHPDFKKPLKLKVQMRPKEPTMARRGFRAYAWYQLVDFLEALLPPHQEQKSRKRSAAGSSRTVTDNKPAGMSRIRLLPEVEVIRMDFVNFGDDMLQFPPAMLHDLACHQLGRSVNEVILTGLPSDEPGFRVSTELSGLLRDEGLLVDHAPILVSQKSGVRYLPCEEEHCHYTSRVVRAMDPDRFPHHHHDHDEHEQVEFPAAPAEEGEPPEHEAVSCRTIWKRTPIKLDDTSTRQWELYDRVSGLPWDDVADEVTMFDGADSDGEGMPCENCGEIHIGAIPPEDMMDLYEDL